MTSGIYKLTFSSGRFYIGKSNDIERRWKEHLTKFDKGTAAAAMQKEYYACGTPNHEIMLHCHEDHIDLMEAFLISAYKGPLMLNASYPKPPNLEDQQTFAEWGDQTLPFSTAEHIRYMVKLKTEIEELQDEIASKDQLIEDIKDGTELELIEETLDDTIAEFRKYRENSEARIHMLKNRNWFQRLFNL